jgi:hypothetical protein
MRSATRVTISTFGALIGLAGFEHGLGEILQGNVAPQGMLIASWPGSAFFRSLAGEPALTILPNLLLTGLLAILVSLLFLGWAVLFIQRKHGGWVLMGLSILMLLVGGGIFPPILGILMGAVATRINAPLNWWRAPLSVGTARFLGKLWFWSFGACLIAWLCMFPGIAILDYFFGVNSPDRVYILLACMFGFLFSTIFAGFIYDVQFQPFPHPDPFPNLEKT